MTEVLFSHLTESTLEEAVPSLLERSLERGWRAAVQTASEERRDMLDNHLWIYRDDSFLAHGTDGAPHAAHQPVLLTTGSGNDNGAQVRFVVDGAAPPDLSGYERGVVMFDGHDEDQHRTDHDELPAFHPAIRSSSTTRVVRFVSRHDL